MVESYTHIVYIYKEEKSQYDNKTRLHSVYMPTSSLKCYQIRVKKNWFMSYFLILWNRSICRSRIFCFTIFTILITQIINRSYYNYFFFNSPLDFIIHVDLTQ